MSFAQSEYILFLALVLALFPFLPKKGRPLGMLVASYTFYLAQVPWHAWLLIGTSVMTFVCALGMDKASTPAKRKGFFATSLFFTVGSLVVFKYSGLLARGWNAALGWGLWEWSVPDWVLPLGISFYTFQVVGYTIDVYRRRIAACRNFVDYGLYVAFFPQLIAGPIERAGHLLPQLRNMEPTGLANLSVGMRRILWGLLKKGVLADRFRPMLTTILLQPEGHDPLSLLVTSFGLLAVLYLDFSAYTDIARGSARLFGVELVENFKTPFAATSVSDFTRRWHVSLIRWIEDYMYAPLVRGRLTHAKIWRANLIVAGAFGLWHGAYGSYVTAGLLLGACVAVQHSSRLRSMHLGKRKAGMSMGGGFVGWASTMVIWSLFVVCLFAADGNTTLEYYAQMGKLKWPEPSSLRFIGIGVLCLSVGLAVHLGAAKVDLERLWTRTPWVARILFWVGLVWVIGSKSAHSSEAFVYFRF